MERQRLVDMCSTSKHVKQAFRPTFMADFVRERCALEMLEHRLFRLWCSETKWIMERQRLVDMCSTSKHVKQAFRPTFMADFVRGCWCLEAILKIGQKVRYPHLFTSRLTYRIGITWCMHSIFSVKSHFLGSTAARCENMLWCKPLWVALSWGVSYAPYAKGIKRFKN